MVRRLFAFIELFLDEFKHLAPAKATRRILIVTSNLLPLVGIFVFDWLPGIVLFYFCFNFALKAVFDLPCQAARFIAQNRMPLLFKIFLSPIAAIFGSLRILLEAGVCLLFVPLVIHFSYAFAAVDYAGWLRWEPSLSETEIETLIRADYGQFFSELLSVKSLSDYIASEWFIITILILFQSYYLIQFFLEEQYRDKADHLLLQYGQKLIYTLAIGGSVLMLFCQVILGLTPMVAGSIMVVYYLALNLRDELEL